MKMGLQKRMVKIVVLEIILCFNFAVKLLAIDRKQLLEC